MTRVLQRGLVISEVAGAAHSFYHTLFQRTHGPADRFKRCATSFFRQAPCKRTGRHAKGIPECRPEGASTPTGLVSKRRQGSFFLALSGLATRALRGPAS